jgi:membrane-associated phospholipid phosphatase
MSLFVLGHVRECRATMFLIFLTFFGCYVVFAFFPIEAPNFISPKISGSQTDYPNYWLVHHWMQSRVTKGCGLPSPHVAVSATAAWCAYRYLRLLFPIYAILAGSIAVAAVYCRLRFALDSVFGLIWAVWSRCSRNDLAQAAGLDRDVALRMLPEMPADDRERLRQRDRQYNGDATGG